MPKKKKKEEEEEIKCPECGSVHLVRDYDRGETVCEDCGLVLDELLIDVFSEVDVQAPPGAASANRLALRYRIECSTEMMAERLTSSMAWFGERRPLGRVTRTETIPCGAMKPR